MGAGRGANDHVDLIGIAELVDDVHNLFVLAGVVVSDQLDLLAQQAAVGVELLNAVLQSVVAGHADIAVGRGHVGKIADLDGLAGGAGGGSAGIAVRGRSAGAPAAAGRKRQCHGKSENCA